MKKVLKKYFIPYEANEFKPHFLREKSVLINMAVIALIFLGPLFYATAPPVSKFLASILPEVLIDLTNLDRSRTSLHSLKVNTLLQAAAHKKAGNMAEKGYFAHVSPDGKTPWYWIIQAGYHFSAAGENLAVYFSDSRDVQNAWMNSASHRANILNKNFTEIGIAAVKGIYQGRETIFVVEIFGRPSSIPIPRSLTEKISFTGRQELEKVAADTTRPIGSPAIAPAAIEKVDEMFIALDEYGMPPESKPPAAEKILYASRLETISASPQKLTGYLYLFLGVTVSISLLLMIFIKIRHQHPKHIFYALSLLIFIVLAAYFQQKFISADILIL